MHKDHDCEVKKGRKDRKKERQTERQKKKNRVMKTVPKGQPSRRSEDDIVTREPSTWSRTASDRQQWKALMLGSIWQWRDDTSVT